ncbi:MAG TPA: hypothetical protein H9780_09695 [Candidatus Mediterraneibacter merdavium]|nr:hypothetical protein [Candidatus Mediterraneibacter merdavium]
MGRKCWRTCVKEAFYCKPCLNRWILCIRKSTLEVCKILNCGCGHGDRNRHKQK